MSKFFSIISFILVFAFSTSCFKDQDDLNALNNFSVVGTWELTNWTLQIPIDLNDDAISSINLLDEALCNNNETLTFDTDGIVASNMSYNPQVTISLTNGTTDNYIFDVECDMDGSIGAFGSYTQNNDFITLFETTATLNGNQLTVVYEDAIDIFNEDLNEVVETKDLTLVYTKK
jgi:hypothetical protein